MKLGTIDWKSGLGSLALVYLAGPMLLLAYGIQRWSAASSWDWRDRWASVRAFSVIFGLCYLVCLAFLLLLLPPFAAQEHLLRPFWQQTSLLVASSIWPPGVEHILIRWLFTLPLAPTFALIMERRDPHSGPQHYLRVALPGEIPEPEPEPTGKVTTVLSPAPQQPAEPKPKRRRTTGTTTPKKKKAEPKPTVVLQEQTQAAGATTASSEQGRLSLWDQTDWSKVPDDDPAKKLAMAEARRQQGMQIRYVQHSLEEATTEASAGSSTAAPTTPSATNEQPAEEHKPKKRIDWSQVDE